MMFVIKIDQLTVEYLKDLVPIAQLLQQGLFMFLGAIFSFYTEIVLQEIEISNEPNSLC